MPNLRRLWLRVPPLPVRGLGPPYRARLCRTVRLVQQLYMDRRVPRDCFSFVWTGCRKLGSLTAGQPLRCLCRDYQAAPLANRGTVCPFRAFHFFSVRHLPLHIQRRKVSTGCVGHFASFSFVAEVLLGTLLNKLYYPKGKLRAGSNGVTCQWIR